MNIIIHDKRSKDIICRKVNETEEGSKYCVEIKKYVKDKTAEQRGWFHKLCTILGNETGYTMADIKDLAKKTLYGTHTVVIGSKRAEVLMSSEKLLRDEYSRLIETVYQLGAEVGIPLPPSRHDESA